MTNDDLSHGGRLPVDVAQDGRQGGGPCVGVGAADDCVAVIPVREVVVAGDFAGGAGDGGEFGWQSEQGESGGERGGTSRIAMAPKTGTLPTTAAKKAMIALSGGTAWPKR